MDRNTELKFEYEDALRMIERFQQRQKLVVEGDWYLFERISDGSLIGDEGELLRSVSTKSDLKKFGLSFEGMLEKGWTATPIKIFREGRTEDAAAGSEDSGIGSAMGL